MAISEFVDGTTPLDASHLNALVGGVNDNTDAISSLNTTVGSKLNAYAFTSLTRRISGISSAALFLVLNTRGIFLVNRTSSGAINKITLYGDEDTFTFEMDGNDIIYTNSSGIALTNIYSYVSLTLSSV